MKATTRFGMMFTVVALILSVHAGTVLADSDNYAEDFETLIGQSITNYSGWTAAETNSIIVSTNYSASYTGSAVGYPIDYDHTANTGALKIENGVTNDVAAGLSSQTNWVDTVLAPVFSDEPPEVPEVGAVAGIYFNTNNHPVVMHTPSNTTAYAEWVEIPDVTLSTGDWVRLTITADFGPPQGSGFQNSTRFYQIYIDGTLITSSNAFIAPDRQQGTGPSGSYFGNRALRGRSTPVTNVVVKGTGYLDDLVMTNSLSFSQTPPSFIETLPSVDNTIYYGQTLADVMLSGGSATNEAGGTVGGSFAFTTPGTFPTVGTNSYEVTFSPTGDYLNAVGLVDVVTVRAATYVDTLPTVSQLTEGDTLADAGLTGGSATNASGTTITGSYAFQDPTNTVPPVGTNAYNVIFTPNLIESYLTTTGQVDIVVTGSGGGGTTTNGTPTSWYDNLGITTNAMYPTYDDLDHADSDGDGVLNWREYVAGTLPGNSNSVFKVLSISVTPPNLTMSWMGGTNGPSSPYMLYGAASLETMPIVWSAITNQTRMEGTNTVTDVNAGSNLYFRVLATP